MSKNGKKSKEPSNNKNGNNNNNNSNNSNNSNSNLDPLASCFFSLSPEQFTLLSSLIGIALIDNLSLGQQNSLGNFIVNVGQAILTAAAQGQLLQSANSQDNGSDNNGSQDNNTNQEIQMLKQQICALEYKLNNLNVN